MIGSHAAYGKHAGISRQAVDKMVLSGRITETAEGLIDFEQADLQRAENTDITKPSNSVTGDPMGASSKRQPAATQTLAKHQARRARAKAEIDELELARMKSELISSAEVGRRWEDLARRARQRLEAIPDRLAAQLAAETDQAEVHRLLREEIRVACNELAGD